MSAQTAPAPAAPAYLSINNIEVIYDHVILVLKGVSLTVPEGKVVALLAPTAPARRRHSRPSRTCCAPSAAR
jgi:hypothetical protein